MVLGWMLASHGLHARGLQRASTGHICKLRAAREQVQIVVIGCRETAGPIHMQTALKKHFSVTDFYFSKPSTCR